MSYKCLCVCVWVCLCSLVYYKCFPWFPLLLSFSLFSHTLSLSLTHSPSKWPIHKANLLFDLWPNGELSQGIPDKLCAQTIDFVSPMLSPTAIHFPPSTYSYYWFAPRGIHSLCHWHRYSQIRAYSYTSMHNRDFLVNANWKENAKNMSKAIFLILEGAAWLLICR